MYSFLVVSLLASLAVTQATFGYSRYYGYGYGGYYGHHSSYRCGWFGCYRYGGASGRERVTPPPREAVCSRESDCSSSNYCDRYLNRCKVCKALNGLCRRDENCCEGRVCEWGCCKEPKKPSSEGSVCKYDVDCNEGLCCAKEQGRFICKRLGKMGESCFEPEGGLGYSQHHKCPCGQGLRCQEYRYRSRRHSYGYYAEHHECVRKSTPVTEAPSTEAPMSGDGATTTDAPRSFVINTVEPMQPSEPPPEKKKKKNNKRKGKGRRDG